MERLREELEVARVESQKARTDSGRSRPAEGVHPGERGQVRWSDEDEKVKGTCDFRRSSHII